MGYLSMLHFRECNIYSVDTIAILVNHTEDRAREDAYAVVHAYISI